jgi:hypothetical protein
LDETKIWAKFNFYDIKTNGITILIIDSPMMKPRLISLPSISEGFCTSEHSQLFFNSQKLSFTAEPPAKVPIEIHLHGHATSAV